MSKNTSRRVREFRERQHAMGRERAEYWLTAAEKMAVDSYVRMLRKPQDGQDNTHDRDR